MAEALLACERSYERLARVYESLTRDHECLRVLGGLSEAGIAEFIGFSGWRRPAGMQALVRALDERLRVFTRDHESLRVLGWLSEAGFAGSIGIFGMAGVPLT